MDDFFPQRIVCHFHKYRCLGKTSFSLHNVSCPGATMKDSDYHNGNPMCEEQQNQSFYTFCKTNDANQRMLMLFSGFLWLSFTLYTLFAFKCDMFSNWFGY